MVFLAALTHPGPMTTTLITGGNRSLGYETARQLIAAGHDVWIGARDPERGRLAAEELGAKFVQLDVTDDASVAAAVETVGELDVLINNAGISGGRVAPADTTVDNLRPVFETNVFGPLRVLQAFRPLLERSKHPVVVNVSSGMGSMTITSDPERVESTFSNLTYSPSKTALNMLTSQWARAYPRI
jgi:NAD(P)-dependent dehydrogenase (short-subunit alcohol dehydrogenase family)